MSVELTPVPLKPCPLCSKEVILYEQYINNGDHWDENEYYISCESCNLRYGSIMVDIRRVTKELVVQYHNQLAEGWNKRKLWFPASYE